MNSGVAAGTPDGQLEAQSSYTYSPEDVDQNGKLDNWGGANIGHSFQLNTFSVTPNLYLTAVCTISNATSRTGAR